ncbi:MAG: sulfotransferase family 2 domain-containing protein [Bacteroidota bacterium]
MIYSEKHRIIFIASPKTGTVTVQSLLLEHLPDARKNRVPKGEQTFKIFGHAKAVDIRNQIGADYYDQHETIAFVRDPLAKFVSSYFFYRGHKRLWNQRPDIKVWAKLKIAIRLLFAKSLPFKIWAMLYPYKSNWGYLTDKQGNIIVKHIGRTQYLKEDLIRILNTIGVDTDDIEVGRKNSSKHSHHLEYYQANWFRTFVEYKLRKDIKLYEQLTTT